MMQTPSSNSYQLNMKMGKQPPTSTMMTSTLMSNSSRKTSCSDNASDIVDADYVDRNIPKMELLKISYVSRSRNNLTQSADDSEVVQLRAKKRNHPKQQLYQRSHSDGVLKVSELAKLSGCTEKAQLNTSGNKKSTSTTPTTTTTISPSKGPPSKSQPLPMPSHHQNPLKYTVYKKHNSCDTTAALKSEKLQYTNDDAIFKAKKKYSMFDSRKRNSIDNIQFYFDSKSYERHVDNKIYGVLMPNANNNSAEKAAPSSGNGAKASVKRLAPAAPPPNYENKSNSWNFVKATKSLLNGSHVSRMASGQKYMKNVPSAKKMQRDSSLVDLSRIGQLFRETRRASADDLLDGGRIPIRSESKARTMSESHEGIDNKTASTSKKIKKLSTDFENKCLCDYKPKQLRDASERKVSAPAYLFSDANLNRLNEHCMRSRRKLEFPDESKSGNKIERSPPPLLPPKHKNRMVKCNSADEKTAQIVDNGFYLLEKVRSKSVPEHCMPLFGHLQSNCNASSSTCGYKNCTFINCPMSSITAALSNANRDHHSNDKMCSKTSINATENEHNHELNRMKNGHNISITKIDTISNKSKLYLKTKDFNDEDDGLLKDFERNGGDGVTLNNLKNLKNTTNLNVNGNNAANSCCTNNNGGGTTIPIKFMPNQQNLNNSMKCKSVEKLDFNSTSTIENKKCNNVLSSTEKMLSFSKNDDDNRVKIFIRNPPVSQYSATTSNSPIYESTTSSSADSVSDYYDSVPNDSDSDKRPTDVPDTDGKCNINDFGITPTTNLLTPASLNKQSPGIDLSTASGKNLKNLFPSRLGCDGAIFWNDCFYYDEHACCNCKADSDKASNSNETRSTSDFCSCSQNQSSTNSSGDAEDDDDLEVIQATTFYSIFL